MTKTIAKQTTLIVVIILINAFSIKSTSLSRPEFAVNDKNRSTVFTSSIFLDQYTFLPDYSMNLTCDLRLGVLAKTIRLTKTPPTLSAGSCGPFGRGAAQRRQGQAYWKDFPRAATIKVNSINHDA